MYLLSYAIFMPLMKVELHFNITAVPMCWCMINLAHTIYRIIFLSVVCSTIKQKKTYEKEDNTVYYRTNNRTEKQKIKREKLYIVEFYYLRGKK